LPLTKAAITTRSESPNICPQCGENLVIYALTKQLESCDGSLICPKCQARITSTR
jgi:hypothetical protein